MADPEYSIKAITDYNITINTNYTLTVCYDKPVSYGSGLWLENSLATTMPLFVLQFGIILALNRILSLFAVYCGLPRIVTDIFAGFLVGPSGLQGWFPTFLKNVFPFSSMMALETMSAMTLIYYMFLIGLEIDVKSIRRSNNKKAMVLAIAGIIFSLPVGCGLYYLLLTNMGRKPMPPSTGISHIRGALMWGVALSISEFPEIAKILANLKLLLSENGQLALTSALTNDMFSWTFIVVGMTTFHDGTTLSLISISVFALLCLFVIHPFAEWLVQKYGATDRDLLEDQVIFILHVVLVFALLGDGLGGGAITGAYLLGTVTPKGAIKNTIQDRVQEFVNTFMMPLFFAIIGLRLNVREFAVGCEWLTVVVVFVLAFLTKILFTFLISMLYQMPLMEGLSLGLLMNTKGVLALIALKAARDRTVLDNQTFGVMIFTCWLMTIPVGPVLAATNKLNTTDIGSSQRRTMQGTRPGMPLRVLACVHTQRDGNVITNLLKASYPTVKSPIQVFAVELIKMTSRPQSALLIKDAPKPKKINAKSSKNFFGSFKVKRDNTEDTLRSFDNLTQAIFADKLRVVSDYSSMHQDIFHLARQRGVTLILATFYKQPTYDGLGLGAATAKAANIVNRDRANRDETKVVLENLVGEQDQPCSLGIFIDRGLGQKRAKELRIVMFYNGGPDDREALSYAWRMSKNPDVQLTVMRLLWDNPEDEYDETDDDYIRHFQFQTRDMASVRYLDKVVKDEKETVALLNKVGEKGFDLYIAGRGRGRKTSLAQVVDPVLEEPVLGPIGDALADLNSAAETSILIFQSQLAAQNESEYAYFEGHGDLKLRGGRMTWRASDRYS